ncbi:hypothetical protein QQ045_027176 [Rhodiola kirilowii]
MDPRLVLIPLFLLICSSYFPVSSAEGAGSPPCVQKLLVCQPYLKNPSNPSALCCAPLKDLIANDPKCLCGLFNNPDLLKMFNVTMEEALQLPKACGSKADVSKCNKDINVPTVSPTSSSSVPSTNGTAPADHNKTSAASSDYARTLSGGAVCLMGFLMTLFV